jgi:hypothetical protein
MTMRFLAVVPVAAVVLLGRSTHYDAAMRCSLMSVPTDRDSSVVFFVGTAQPDTVFAGPGAVEPRGRGGHSGSGTSRSVYGQVVRIDTIGGTEARSIEQALASNGPREVVVVP